MASTFIVTAVLLAFVADCSYGDTQSSLHAQVGILNYVHVVEGGRAEIPCNISSANPTDKVQLVLWYKDGNGRPIYSYDLRDNNQSEKVRNWSDEKTLGSRGHFDIKSTKAALVIDDVRASDEGIYSCRIDFQRSPTRHTRTNFSIITPVQSALASLIRPSSWASRESSEILDTSSTDTAVLCSDEGAWHKFNGSLYLLSSKAVIFDEAPDMCDSLEADLVKIDNDEEFDFLGDQFFGVEFWVGANDRQEEGRFTWLVDDSLLPNNSPWWCPREPNNYRNGEDCVHFSFRHEKMELNDLNCLRKRYVVCEKPSTDAEP